MDTATVAAYDMHAHDFAAGMRRCALDTIFAGRPGIFHPGASPADVGCGSGRDVAWLPGLGYRAVGYDASEGTLLEPIAVGQWVGPAPEYVAELAEFCPKAGSIV